MFFGVNVVDVSTYPHDITTTQRQRIQQIPISPNPFPFIQHITDRQGSLMAHSVSIHPLPM